MRRYLAVFAGFLMIAGICVVAPTAATASEQALNTVVRSTPVNYTPNVLDGTVFSIAEIGDMIVLGGQFTQVQASTGGAVLSRNNIVGFNKNNGQISTSFAPQFNSTVRSVVAAADGTSVYVGGQFGTLNGASVTKVTKLSLSNGSRVTAFNPGNIDAVVHDMKLVGSKLYVAGEFSTIKGTPRSKLASLNPTTGALLPELNVVFDGTHLGGTTFVHKFDVSPDGKTMVVTGNFRTMDGLDRVQVGMIDLSTPQASVAAWQTESWKPNCYSSFAYYLNDLDFSPDGSYFVLGSMGGYGSGPPSLCDSISKWQTSARGVGITPVWTDYTGGDSIYALESTGETIYFGGHNRWVNNPYRADAAGQGAVSREGIGALSSTNGMPIDWNPGRDRGRGVFDLLATTQGLWVGSDTDRIARYLYRARIAMFPLVGGHAIPTASAPVLPVDVLQSGAPSTTVDARYMYRVNTGGETVSSLDAGPDWVGDTSPPGSNYRNTGNAAQYPSVPQVTAAVPATTPLAVYSTERWDDSGSPELTYSFPVPAGTHVQVRVYLSDRCGCTTTPGSRVYSMTLDGQMAFENFDANGTAGHDVGTMLSKDIVSDGTVDLTFLHNIENPAVNGLEIVNLDASAPPATSADQMKALYFNGTTGSGSTAAVTGSVPWDSVRGGFVANGSLYLATATGQFQQRSFNGTQIGSATELDLYGLSDFAVNMQSMTGLFYSNGRIYYTLSGQNSLYMRYFDLDSKIVGAQQFTITGATGGMAWANVRGMFLAGGKLYWASSDGNLNAMTWTDALGNGAVSGTSTAVSGPSMDGTQWAAKSLIAKPGTGSVIPNPNQPPVARFTNNCTSLNCTFTGTGSSDPDGTIAGYAWTSSDGGTGSTGVYSHSFATPGTFSVSLTVTDNKGATSVSTANVTVTAPPTPNVPPVASFTSNCTFLNCTFTGTGSSDSDGTIASWVWALPAGATANGEIVSYTFAAAGTYPVKLTVTDDDGATAVSTVNVTVTASPVANQSPVASFTNDCTFLNCTFDGSGSSDPDGTIASWAWALPAGATANGEIVSHTFAAAGTYNVVLTVKDNLGASNVKTVAVTVADDPGPPVSSAVSFVSSATENSSSGSVMNHSLVTPAQVLAGDVMVAAFTTNSGTVAVTPPAGWSVVAESATASMRGMFLSKVATAADAGSTLTVRTAAYGRGSLTLSVYRDAQVSAASFVMQPETVSRTTHTTPTATAATGNWALQYWSDKTAATTGWAGPAGQTVRQMGAGTGAGHMSWLLTDSNGPVTGTSVGGLTATATVASSSAVMGTVVISAAP